MTLLVSGCSNSVPECNSSDVNKSLESIAIGVFARDPGNPLLAAQVASKFVAGVQPGVVFSNEHEIGYDSALKTRGCTAKVSISMGSDSTKMSRTIGYTIKLDSANQGEFITRTMDQAYVSALFSSKSIHKKPSMRAAPLGRTEIRRVFRSGLKSIDKAMTGRCYLCEFTGEAQRDNKTYENRVKEIEPIGACKVVDDKASCPLLIYYRDDTLAALSPMLDLQPYSVIRADFTFLKNGQKWKVGPHFSDDFFNATKRDRINSISGHETSANGQTPP